jgi:hypothetical protein
MARNKNFYHTHKPDGLPTKGGGEKQASSNHYTQQGKRIKIKNIENQYDRSIKLPKKLLYYMQFIDFYMI